MSTDEVTIDVAFDFRTDAGGKDPDSHSPTLRRYHRLLWSKPLPSGEPFDGFHPPPIPTDIETYREYRRRSIAFIESRNCRINQLQGRVATTDAPGVRAG